MSQLPQSESPPAGAPPGRRASFIFIFISAVTTAMSFGLMIPILPNLVRQMTGETGAHATAAAAGWILLFTTFGGLMSFFAGPILGLFSDRFGRRPVLLVSLAGLGFDFLFMAFAPNLWWLLVGRLISGATSGAFSTANAYVADVAEPHNRARYFGLMGSAFSFGFLAGPAVGGFLGEHFGLRAPFLASAALTLVNTLYGAFVLPESLPPERRQPRFDWKKANPIGSLTLLRSHHELFGLAGIYFLNQVAQMIWPSVFVLYVGQRYGWSPAFTGVSMMASGVMGVLTQSFLVGPAVKRFGERGALIIGSSVSAFSFCYYAWAPVGWAYLAWMPISSLGSLAIPGLLGLMTRHVSPMEQGQLQGANQSLAGISGLIGPSLFLLSFRYVLEHNMLWFTGVPFLIAGIISAGCLLLALRTPQESSGIH